MCFNCIFAHFIFLCILFTYVDKSATTSIKDYIYNDIYVANVYIVPDGSVCHDDEIFYLLHDQLSKIPASAEVVLCGDYNARTGVIPDFNMDPWNGSNGEMNRLMPDDLDRYLNVMENMYKNGILIRHSKDESTVNKHGWSSWNCVNLRDWWFLMGSWGKTEVSESILGKTPPAGVSLIT